MPKHQQAWPIDRTIKEVRWMANEERNRAGFEESFGKTPLLVLSDDSLIFPASDEEGNGLGFLFGEVDGDQVYVIPEKSNAT